MTNKELKEEFIEWHDKEHARTGYWPSSGEIANWWLSALDARVGEIEGEIKKLPTTNLDLILISKDKALNIIQAKKGGVWIKN